MESKYFVGYSQGYNRIYFQHHKVNGITLHFRSVFSAAIALPILFALALSHMASTFEIVGMALLVIVLELLALFQFLATVIWHIVVEETEITYQDYFNKTHVYHFSDITQAYVFNHFGNEAIRCYSHGNRMFTIDNNVQNYKRFYDDLEAHNISVENRVIGPILFCRYARKEKPPKYEKANKIINKAFPFVLITLLICALLSNYLSEELFYRRMDAFGEKYHVYPSGSYIDRYDVCGWYFYDKKGYLYMTIEYKAPAKPFKTRKRESFPLEGDPDLFDRDDVTYTLDVIEKNHFNVVYEAANRVFASYDVYLKQDDSSTLIQVSDLETGGILYSNQDE
ncbi:DUF6560 family protein [Butyricicoccus sp.]|uniref:DUF6560 family protein n=1 Tax=Butyricicoccus sp. TaxID=2049021 RepID=UPI003F168D4F